MLQVPFFICRYLLLNIQVPFSTRQQAIHGTVIFTPDLLTPHTAFPSLPTTVPVFWNVSAHFFYPCAHSVFASSTRCHLNQRKLNIYRATRPPSWENGTWQVPSQLSVFMKSRQHVCHVRRKIQMSDVGFVKIIIIWCLCLPIGRRRVKSIREDWVVTQWRIKLSNAGDCYLWNITSDILLDGSCMDMTAYQQGLFFTTQCASINQQDSPDLNLTPRLLLFCSRHKNVKSSKRCQ